MKGWTALSTVLCSARWGLAVGWCLESETGPCAFNVRSKAADELPRSIVFYNSADAPKAAIRVTPAKRELQVLLGGDAERDQCMRVTEAGFLWLGTGLPPVVPLYQVEVSNVLEPSVLSLAGKRDKAGTCAAVRLADLQDAGGASANLFFNPLAKMLGVSFTTGQNVETDPTKASVSVSSNLAPGSVLIDETGRLRLLSVGNAESQHAGLTLARARGSHGIPQIVIRDDIIGKVEFSAYDGDNQSIVASLRAVVHGQVSKGKVGSKLEFAVTDATSAKLGVRAILDGEQLSMMGETDLRLDGGDVIVQGKGSISVDQGSISVGKQGSLVVENRATIGAGGLQVGGDVTLKQGK